MPQVICDADYIVTAACCNTPGSTNVRQAYKEAEFDQLVEGLPGNYDVVGDTAYGATDKMLVPYPGCDLDADQQAFNFFQSQGRMCIEQTFGIMVHLRNTASVVHAITRLHNYLRRCRSEPPPATARFLNENGTIRSNRWATPSDSRNIRENIRNRTFMRPAENIPRNRRWRTAITRRCTGEWASPECPLLSDIVVGVPTGAN
ncbi:unnamed protein product [Ectocarpus sp. CCAP 1310/34]|nr:unnamed protein product [Ectocarpus sp. CCAP 1310/34]